MSEPSYVTRARSSYDAVAEDYAVVVKPRFDDDALGRGMLRAFAELVTGQVADVGCGPGHVTAYLDSLRVSVFGVDLSPKMVELARRTYPDLRFSVGSMTALDLADGELGGIVAWWSILHLPPSVLSEVFADFSRMLAPGGHLLLGFHVGDEHRRPDAFNGSPVTYDVFLLDPDRVTSMLSDTGMTVIARLLFEGPTRPAACLLAVPGRQVGDSRLIGG